MTNRIEGVPHADENQRVKKPISLTPGEELVRFLGLQKNTPELGIECAKLACNEPSAREYNVVLILTNKYLENPKLVMEKIKKTEGYEKLKTGIMKQLLARLKGKLIVIENLQEKSDDFYQYIYKNYNDTSKVSEHHRKVANKFFIKYTMKKINDGIEVPENYIERLAELLLERINAEQRLSPEEVSFLFRRIMVKLQGQTRTNEPLDPREKKLLKTYCSEKFTNFVLNAFEKESENTGWSSIYNFLLEKYPKLGFHEQEFLFHSLLHKLNLNKSTIATQERKVLYWLLMGSGQTQTSLDRMEREGVRARFYDYLFEIAKKGKPLQPDEETLVLVKLLEKDNWYDNDIKLLINLGNFNEEEIKKRLGNRNNPLHKRLWNNKLGLNNSEKLLLINSLLSLPLPQIDEEEKKWLVEELISDDGHLLNRKLTLKNKEQFETLLGNLDEELEDELKLSDGKSNKQLKQYLEKLTKKKKSKRLILGSSDEEETRQKFLQIRSRKKLKYLARKIYHKCAKGEKLTPVEEQIIALSVSSSTYHFLVGDEVKCLEQGLTVSFHSKLDDLPSDILVLFKLDELSKQNEKFINRIFSLYVKQQQQTQQRKKYLPLLKITNDELSKNDERKITQRFSKIAGDFIIKYLKAKTKAELYDELKTTKNYEQLSLELVPEVLEFMKKDIEKAHAHQVQKEKIIQETNQTNKVEGQIKTKTETVNTNKQEIEKLEKELKEKKEKLEQEKEQLGFIAKRAVGLRDKTQGDIEEEVASSVEKSVKKEVVAYEVDEDFVEESPQLIEKSESQGLLRGIIGWFSRGKQTQAKDEVTKEGSKGLSGIVAGWASGNVPKKIQQLEKEELALEKKIQSYEEKNAQLQEETKQLKTKLESNKNALKKNEQKLQQMVAKSKENYEVSEKMSKQIKRSLREDLEVCKTAVKDADNAFNSIIYGQNKSGEITLEDREKIMKYEKVRKNFKERLGKNLHKLIVHKHSLATEANQLNKEIVKLQKSYDKERKQPEGNYYVGCLLGELSLRHSRQRTLEEEMQQVDDLFNQAFDRMLLVQEPSREKRAGARIRDWGNRWKEWFKGCFTSKEEDYSLESLLAAKRYADIGYSTEQVIDGFRNLYNKLTEKDGWGKVTNDFYKWGVRNPNDFGKMVGDLQLFITTYDEGDKKGTLEKARNLINTNIIQSFLFGGSRAEGSVNDGPVSAKDRQDKAEYMFFCWALSWAPSVVAAYKGATGTETTVVSQALNKLPVIGGALGAVCDGLYKGKMAALPQNIRDNTTIKEQRKILTVLDITVGKGFKVAKERELSYEIFKSIRNSLEGNVVQNFIKDRADDLRLWGLKMKHSKSRLERVVHASEIVIPAGIALFPAAGALMAGGISVVGAVGGIIGAVVGGVTGWSGVGLAAGLTTSIVGFTTTIGAVVVGLAAVFPAILVASAGAFGFWLVAHHFINTVLYKGTFDKAQEELAKRKMKKRVIVESKKEPSAEEIIKKKTKEYIEEFNKKVYNLDGWIRVAEKHIENKSERLQRRIKTQNTVKEINKQYEQYKQKAIEKKENLLSFKDWVEQQGLKTRDKWKNAIQITEIAKHNRQKIKTEIKQTLEKEFREKMEKDYIERYKTSIKALGFVKRFFRMKGQTKEILQYDKTEEEKSDRVELERSSKINWEEEAVEEFNKEHPNQTIEPKDFHRINDVVIKEFSEGKRLDFEKLEEVA